VVVKKKAEQLLFIMTFFWGATFILIKEALVFIPPFLFAGVRFLIASVFLLIFLFFRNETFNLKKHFFSREGFLLGFILSISFLFQTLSLSLTSAPNVAFLTSLFVVFVPLLAYFFYKHKLSPTSFVSLFVVLIGLFVLSRPENNNLKTQVSGFNLGDFLALSCALGFASQIMLVSRYTRKIDEDILNFQQILWCGILCFVFSLIFENLTFFRINVIYTNATVWGALLFCAFFATALAFGVQSRYQKHTTEFRASLIYALEPITATLFAIVWSQEKVTLQNSLGFVLLFLGTLISLLR
jgi:drug/metabolite transporter (DMT)-like permease